MKVVTNELLLKWIKNNRITCISCRTPLTLYKIKSRQEPGGNGITYEGMENQDVWTKCASCGSKNNINKLLKTFVL